VYNKLMIGFMKSLSEFNMVAIDNILSNIRVGELDDPAFLSNLFTSLQDSLYYNDDPKIVDFGLKVMDSIIGSEKLDSSLTTAFMKSIVSKYQNEEGIYEILSPYEHIIREMFQVLHGIMSGRDINIAQLLVEMVNAEKENRPVRELREIKAQYENTNVVSINMNKSSSPSFTLEYLSSITEQPIENIISLLQEFGILDEDGECTKPYEGLIRKL